MEGDRVKERGHTLPSKGAGTARTATRSWVTKRTERRGVNSIVSGVNVGFGCVSVYTVALYLHLQPNQIQVLPANPRQCSNEMRRRKLPCKGCLSGWYCNCLAGFLSGPRYREKMAPGDRSPRGDQEQVQRNWNRTAAPQDFVADRVRTVRNGFNPATSQPQVAPNARGHRKFKKHRGRFFYLRSRSSPSQTPKSGYVRPKMAILRTTFMKYQLRPQIKFFSTLVQRYILWKPGTPSSKFGTTLLPNIVSQPCRYISTFVDPEDLSRDFNRSFYSVPNLSSVLGRNIFFFF